MKKLFVLFLLAVIPAVGNAASGTGHSRFKVFGQYGLGFIKPSDMNTVLTALSPRPSEITQSTNYAGGLGINIGPKFELELSYEAQAASSSNGSNKLEISENLAVITGNFYLTRNRASIYVGVGALYPLYSHVTLTISGAKTELDADKTLGYQGLLGVNYMLGNHFSVFAEGGYQYLVSGDVKTAAGAALTVNSQKAKVDLSGMKAAIGLAVHF